MKYDIIAYDFEVFSKAKWWMVVFIDYETREKTIILNNKQELEEYYRLHKDDIFIGYNSRGYDQWILKGILLGKDPFKINDGIIEEDKKGHQLLRNAKEVVLNNFDVANPMNSLKQLEGFMGSMIKESSVPFDLDRPLTEDEIQETIKYCTHDVEETIKVFEYKKEDFDSQLLLIETFDLGMDMFNKTKAQLSAHILGTVKQESIDDEFDFEFPKTLILNKYKYIQDWYRNPRNLTYDRKLEVEVAGCPTTFAYGGVHGAKSNCFREGIILCFDVASLYPSIMINYNCLSRNVLEPKKYEEIKHQRLEFKKQKDKRQAPLKIVLNSTYGILKDKNNPFYDPRMSNQVCVTGQLLLLDLVEKVEHLGEVLQMNTDGVYMYMKDMESVEKVKQIAHEWERRTMLELEFDIYAKIYQRDVNNYIIVDENGHYKSKGCVKKKSPIDYDLPIITKAIINYCVNDIPIEDTINNCDDLMEFQKIVKVSKLYKYAYYGTVKQITEGKNKFTVRDEGIKLPEKVLRVFASSRDDDKGVFKVKNEKKVEKIANTPDKCFIFNEDVKYEKCPDYLDRSYYIELAKEQLNDFLGLNDKVIKIKKSNEEQILEVLNKNYTDFYDVLVDIKLNTNITNAILLKYINIEAFNRFGKCKKLSKYLNLFKMIYGKKSVTPKMIKDINNDEILDILKSNCDYDSIKNTYKNLNSEQALRDIFKYLPDEDIHISTKIKQEYDLYDDLTIKDSSLDENLIFIMNINNTKNPSIIAYNLKYGVVNILKINKEIFNILELRVGDFVYIKSMERKPKVKVIDKVDGVNVLGCSEEFYDWWLNEYEIILRDYGKNNKLIVDTEME
jgi:hypothetical protein